MKKVNFLVEKEIVIIEVLLIQKHIFYYFFSIVFQLFSCNFRKTYTSPPEFYIMTRRQKMQYWDKHFKTETESLSSYLQLQENIWLHSFMVSEIFLLTTLFQLSHHHGNGSDHSNYCNATFIKTWIYLFISYKLTFLVKNDGDKFY